MCVIVLKEENGKLNTGIFDQCWARNGDGGGFVAIENGKVTMEKGIMKKEDFLEKVKPFFGKGSQLILHFRIQSRGGVSSGLTHPFDCSQDNSKVKRYLFHNGTVKALSSLPPGSSDTSVLAEFLKVLNDDDCQKMLANLSEKGHGRFVLVIGTKVFYWGDIESVAKKKVWYSNTRHEQFNPLKDKRPTIGDGCGYDFFNSHYHDGSDYYSKYDKYSKFSESSDELSKNKLNIIKDILKIESVNSGVNPQESDEWMEDIIKEYDLLKLTLDTLKQIKDSKSETPLVDYFLNN